MELSSVQKIIRVVEEIRFLVMKEFLKEKGRRIVMMVSTRGRYALRVLVDLAEQDSDRFVL